MPNQAAHLIAAHHDHATGGMAVENVTVVVAHQATHFVASAQDAANGRAIGDRAAPIRADETANVPAATSSGHAAIGLAEADRAVV